ncbi:hypothetical protein K439DRAFT_280021 [Ramaria rubella]|nr:hypothetical protein K439DRAFT_280021 [Ramaria rubella]
MLPVRPRPHMWGPGLTSTGFQMDAVQVDHAVVPAPKHRNAHSPLSTYVVEGNCMLLISVLGNRSSTVSRPYQAVFEEHRCRLSHLQLGKC